MVGFRLFVRVVVAAVAVAVGVEFLLRHRRTESSRHRVLGGEGLGRRRSRRLPLPLVIIYCGRLKRLGELNGWPSRGCCRIALMALSNNDRNQRRESSLCVCVCVVLFNNRLARYNVVKIVQLIALFSNQSTQLFAAYLTVKR